jgi:class 3 adenylate cyclase
VTKGRLLATLRTSQWHCIYAHEVSPGVIAFLAAIGLAGAPISLCPPGRRLGVIAMSVSFLRPVVPDGRDLLARGTVLHEGGRFLVSAVEVTDGDGNRVALGQQTSLLVPKRPKPHGDTVPDRLLATVLFTDIVGSTRRAEELGDASWRELLDEHHAFVRKQLQVFRGREVKTTGDGFLATFDSPGRAVQCARAIRDGVRHLGLEVRVGLHTGECEICGADVAGIAVHIASRIQGLAGPGEILVSGTVHDLVTGSGLRFSDHGRHELKGIEGSWPLFAVDG